jgi:hypothetical protein
MSLLRAVIRTTAVGALRDQTWAQERVADSSMMPIAQAVYGGPAKPYIMVYTDRDDISPVQAKAELYNGQNRLLQLTIEIGVASAVRDPTGKLNIQIANTDEGMELACDIVQAQALAALIGNPQSAWGEVFKQLTRKVHRVLTVRGGQSGQGVKYSARRVIVVMSTIFDAVPGEVLVDNHPINKFIAMAHSNPFLHVLDTANVIQPLLANINAPSWRQAQAFLGLDTEAVKILNPDGTPLPVPLIETPPYDPFPAPGTPDEYVPVTQDITLQDDDNPEQEWPPLVPQYHDYD